MSSGRLDSIRFFSSADIPYVLVLYFKFLFLYSSIVHSTLAGFPPTTV